MLEFTLIIGLVFGMYSIIEEKARIAIEDKVATHKVNLIKISCDQGFEKTAYSAQVRDGSVLGVDYKADSKFLYKLKPGEHCEISKGSHLEG